MQLLAKSTVRSTHALLALLLSLAARICCGVTANCSLKGDVFLLRQECTHADKYLRPVAVPVLSIVRSEQKQLNVSAVHKLDVAYETATFGMGCFWGAESLYGAQRGVLRTTVGYAGGTKDMPTYRNLGDHTEVLEIDYDPSVITFNQLLNLFWNNHEYGLTTPIKRQYMSLILYHDLEQKRIAEASKAEEQERRAPEIITTEIAPKKAFYAAEDYHQKYRLQGHRDLCATLSLDQKLLQTSYVATKLNGYLSGVGGIKQFKAESPTMGLTPSQLEYCNHYVEKNEGQGLYC